MWISIGVLFAFSWLELALEYCGKFMPYHKIHNTIEEDEDKISKEKLKSSNDYEQIQVEQDTEALQLQPIQGGP